MTFKDAINTYGKEITASFSCGGTLYSDNQIVSMNLHYEGALLCSVMRCLDLELDGVGSISSDTISGVKFGVRAPGGEYQYRQYGTYLVKEPPEYDDDKNALSMVCYDLMLRAMVPYDLQIDYSSGEVTLGALLDAICMRMDWQKGYTTFVNSNVVIDGEKYDSQYTFRDVLDEIAQAAAGTIAFVNDALCVLYPDESGETLDPSNLKSLTIGTKYGPVNSVVLGRSPQEDNIYRQDSDSIEAHGLTEIRIDNNQLMDSHRDDFIQGIFNQLNGLEFYLYELESFGIGYLDLCDRFAFADLAGNSYGTIMLSDNLEITQGVTETSELTAPNETKTDYAAASESDRVLNQTLLRVDKQEQQISALITTTESVASETESIKDQVTKMSEIMMDADSVNIAISTAIGEIDSITTSTGYTFDADGLKISKSGEEMENLLDNTGMYVRRSGEDILTANNEGVSAINLTARQYLIVGNNSRFEDYTNDAGEPRTACFYIGG